MTRLSPTDRDHWHDADGKHRMKDLRVLYGDKWNNATGNYGDPDERAFTRHLIEHEAGDDLAPRDDDPFIVQVLFDKITNNLAQVAKMRELIVAYRQKAAQEQQG